MSDHVTRPVRSGPAWLLRSLALAIWTLLTIVAVVVAVDLGLLPEISSDRVSAQLDAPADVAEPPLPSGPAPVPPAEPPAPTEPAPVPPAEPPTPTGSAPVPPAEPPTVRGLARSAPTSVAVPALGIESPLVRLRLEQDTGALQVPRDYATAGWYADGPYPGQANGPPAVIVGHVDSLTGPAVFFRLREIQPGTEIHVARADGSTAVFRVVDAHQYPKAALPADEVYARRQPSELILITCSGQFDEETGSYLDNFVVTARLDPEASGVPT